MYENGLFEVQFPTLYKNASPLEHDYPMANVPGNPMKRIVLHAWVHSNYSLPLMMYPVALSGPKQRMNYRCLDNYELERKSTNFVEHGGPIGYGDYGDLAMYMKPEGDFEVGTLLLQSKGSSHQLQISKEDVVIRQYNPIYITSFRASLRSCLMNCCSLWIYCNTTICDR
ncbi:uncharacterized protein LOC143020609 [Oratosquilla oratoria]|uniref:uncharacterized protein LOC143020609 n=1 Tax=Oratosquilla oratoria TaxID=337810 RepID=UPI003F7739D4